MASEMIDHGRVRIASTDARTSAGSLEPRIWLQEVEVEIVALRGELAAMQHQWSAAGHVHDEEKSAIAASVRTLLIHAENAASGVQPRHRRIRSWWSGDCIESAFRNLHRAEAEIAKLYDDDRIQSVLPEATARIDACLPSGDFRREAAHRVCDKSGRVAALALSKTIQIGHEAKDQQYAKVRRFRNIVFNAGVLILLFMILFAILVSLHAADVPLCSSDKPMSETYLSCPTNDGPTVGPAGGDVWIVLLLGLLGGAFAAAVSIRKIRGAPTPYNLATALAFLKVPCGALTAVGALLLIGGRAVPGLTALDSQEQILAYALVFGYAQQLLTGLVDRRALDLVAGVRPKESHMHLWSHRDRHPSG